MDDRVMAVCPPEKKRFFEWLEVPLGRMARDIDTTKRLMLTMAAKEGGWMAKDLDWNMPLNNPFGVNDISGGRASGNHRYANLDEAITYWKSKYGPRVRGKKEASSFVYALQHPEPGQGYPYNSAHADTYETVFLDVFVSMGRFMARCGAAE